MPFLVIALAFFSLVFGGTTIAYKNAYDGALERVEKAEKEAADLREERARLKIALTEQEKATLEAQNNRKVIYKTVQKEVMSNADARDWYNTAVPAGFVRVLKDGSKGSGNTRSAR